MKILITSSSGFIGSQLAGQLTAHGHEILHGTRRLTGATNELYLDFNHAIKPYALAQHLQHVDVVINTVGILRDTTQQSSEAIHHHAAAQLWQACQLAGCKVIQLSALGANHNSTSQYHRSKYAGDEALRALAQQNTLDYIILQPSLVFGLTGKSSRWFMQLACLPWCALPHSGKMLVQPIHVDDICAIVIQLLQQTSLGNHTLACVGSQAMPFSSYLQALRQQLGFQRPMVITARPFAHCIAKITAIWRSSPLTPETLTMLNAESHASVTATQTLMQRMPLSVNHFILPTQQAYARHLATQIYQHTVLRGSLALVWFASGILPLTLYPKSSSLALLQQVGIPSSSQTLVLLGASIADVLLGLFTLYNPFGKALWLTQILLILIYSCIIAYTLPSFLIHPFAPILKNLPIVAILVFLALQTPSNRHTPKDTQSC